MPISTGKQTHVPKRYITEMNTRPSSPKRSNGWKKILPIGVIAAAVLLAVICIIIFAVKSRKPTQAEEPIVPASVGILMPDSTVSRWRKDANTLYTSLSKLGYSVSIRYAEGDPDTQIQQLQELRDAGCQVILVASVDGNAMSAAITELQTPSEDSETETEADTETGAGTGSGTEAGEEDEMGADLSPVDDNLIVIAYDSFLSNCDYVDFYIGTDPYESGYLQAAYLVETLDLANDTSSVYHLEIFAGDAEDPYQQMYYAGGMDMLQPYIDSGQLAVLSGKTELESCAIADGSAESAQSRMSEILSSSYTDGTSLHAVFCTSDEMAQGVISALVSGYTGHVYPYITGSGCLEENLAYLLSGYQAMDLVNYTDGMAEDAAMLISYIMEYLYPPEEEPDGTDSDSLPGDAENTEDSTGTENATDMEITTEAENATDTDSVTDTVDNSTDAVAGDADGDEPGTDGAGEDEEEQPDVYVPGTMVTGEDVTLTEALESVLFFSDYLDNGSIAIPSLLFYGVAVTSGNYAETLVETGLFSLAEDGTLIAEP